MFNYVKCSSVYRPPALGIKTGIHYIMHAVYNNNNNNNDARAMWLLQIIHLQNSIHEVNFGTAVFAECFPESRIIINCTCLPVYIYSPAGISCYLNNICIYIYTCCEYLYIISRDTANIMFYIYYYGSECARAISLVTQ